MSTLQQLLVVGAAVSTVLAAPAVPNAERACEPLPHGRGLIPRPDTAEAFQSFPAFSLAATSATTPVGYIQAYSNLVTTFNEPSQFIRYTDLDSYDVSKCAAECGKDDKCNIFGIFFERTPMYKPGPKCPNPSSSTMIKCTLWSGTISPNANINKGQIREQFRIVMAGSNAYVKDITFSNRKDGSSNILKNWIVEKYKNGAAIQVPLDCNGVDTYMGVAAWRDGKFDAQRCLDACKVAGDTDIQSRKCRFVNTYVQRRNGVQVAQHCAMFSEYWPAPFATNLGQLRGDVEISETDSYGLRRVEVKGTACYKPQDLLVPAPLRPGVIPAIPTVSTPSPISAGPSPSKSSAPPVGASSLKPAISTIVSSSFIQPKAQASAPTATDRAVISSMLGDAQATSSGTSAALPRVSGTPSTALGTSSVLPATSPLVPGTASVGSATASVVPSAPSVALATSSAALATPSTPLSTSSTLPVSPPVVSAIYSSALSTPSAAPSSVPATPSILPATASVLPAAPSVAPSSPVVSDTSAALNASSQLPAIPSVTPGTAPVLPATPTSALSTPAAAPAISSAAPSVVPATPSSPLNTSSTALITPSKLPATPSVAQSIPSVLSATPSAAPSASLTPSPIPTPLTSPLAPSSALFVMPTSLPPIEPRRSPLTDSTSALSSTISAHFAARSAVPTSDGIIYATPVSPSPFFSASSPSLLNAAASPTKPVLEYRGALEPLTKGKSGRICWPGGSVCWYLVLPQDLSADPELMQEEWDPEVDKQKWEKNW